MDNLDRFLDRLDTFVASLDSEQQAMLAMLIDPTETTGFIDGDWAISVLDRDALRPRLDQWSWGTTASGVHGLPGTGKT